MHLGLLRLRLIVEILSNRVVQIPVVAPIAATTAII
jgi:hypothetical protein